MKDFQERVVAEAQELSGKLDRLQAFIVSSVFDALPLDEKKRLTRQVQVMSEYLTILRERIAHF